MDPELRSKMVVLGNILVGTFNKTALYLSRQSTSNYHDVKMSMEVTSLHLILTVSTDHGVVSSFNVPIPYEVHGCWFIKTNQTKRPIGLFLDMIKEVELSYDQVLSKLLLEPINGDIISTIRDTKKVCLITQLVDGAVNENIPVVIKNITSVISKFCSVFPVHVTLFNSYVMNRRVFCIDPKWREIVSKPKEVLAYQVAKNEKWFTKGYTSLGLADQSLTDNYLLKMDLRTVSPYGIPYFNPQRNLYSTLGMKGKEEPWIFTETEVELKTKGVERHGFNLWTLFYDVPNVYEDQILVSKDLIEYITINKNHNYICFGQVDVMKHDQIHQGDVLSISEDGEVKKFEEPCEYAEILACREIDTVVGGLQMKATYITVQSNHKLCDGWKFTNRHGNKGIVRVADLGTAIDPVTGEQRPIDLVVSAKTINKRKNVSQIVEILHNLVNINDNCSAGDIVATNPVHTIESLRDILISKGYYTDGATDCTLGEVGMLLDTSKPIVNGSDNFIEPNKNVRGIFGPMFWGVIKLPEVNVWDNSDLRKKDSNGIQEKGQKMGAVEFRAINFRFGNKSTPILKELISYTNGNGPLNELYKVLRSRKGMYHDRINASHWVENIKPLNVNGRTIFTTDEIKGTVCDEEFMPTGGYLRLPVTFQTAILMDNDELYEGRPYYNSEDLECIVIYNTNSIYIPPADMRSCWRHDCGMFGMNDIGAMINNIVTISQKPNTSTTDTEGIYLQNQLYNSIATYYRSIDEKIGSKNGAIANWAMAVRSPFSCKATATLSTTIPFGCVEIHTSLAKLIGVKHGEVAIIERYPLLGFMGILPIKVLITDDEQCRWTIRVGHNSLTSAGLDFDGDTVYITALKSAKAKEVLENEWRSPDPECWAALQELNFKKGTPMMKGMTLLDYNCTPHQYLTNEIHAGFVEKNTGVKVQTGIVIASMYNVMRIIETDRPEMSRQTAVNVEKFIEKAGQSVFSQKHGAKSLCDIVIEALALADDQALLDAGFEADAVAVICNTIRSKQKQLNVKSLKYYHETLGQDFPFLNKVVKTQNPMYYLARAEHVADSLGILSVVENVQALDFPSRVYIRTMSGELNLGTNPFTDAQDAKLIAQINEVQEVVATEEEPKSHKKTACAEQNYNRKVSQSICRDTFTIINQLFLNHKPRVIENICHALQVNPDKLLKRKKGGVSTEVIRKFNVQIVYDDDDIPFDITN